jgi:Transport protein particle (TRAPP) component
MLTSVVSQEVVHGGAVQFESMGHGVGYRLTERLCQAKALSGESLEAVKFICKDLWGETFKKQVCAMCIRLEALRGTSIASHAQ